MRLNYWRRSTDAGDGQEFAVRDQGILHMKSLAYRIFHYWRLASVRVETGVRFQGVVNRKCAGVGEGW